MAKQRLRGTLSAPGLLRGVRACFDKLEDPVSGRRFSLSECPVFGLKYPSLLQFDRDARTDEVVRANLKTLYAIERAPCDTALRERLDEVDPRELRPAFKRVFAALQRGNRSGHERALPPLGRRDGVLLLVERALRALLREASRHVLPPDAGRGDPEQREVFPLAPEPIIASAMRRRGCSRMCAASTRI